MKKSIQFISFGEIDYADMTSRKGVYTFDKPKENPYQDFPYLVRVGGGYQGFRTKREAVKFYQAN